jgi:hypothetical protein
MTVGRAHSQAMNHLWRSVQFGENQPTIQFPSGLIQFHVQATLERWELTPCPRLQMEISLIRTGSLEESSVQNHSLPPATAIRFRWRTHPVAKRHHRQAPTVRAD